MSDFDSSFGLISLPNVQFEYFKCWLKYWQNSWGDYCLPHLIHTSKAIACELLLTNVNERGIIQICYSWLILTVTCCTCSGWRWSDDAGDETTVWQDNRDAEAAADVWTAVPWRATERWSNGDSCHSGRQKPGSMTVLHCFISRVSVCIFHTGGIDNIFSVLQQNRLGWYGPVLCKSREWLD